MKVTTKEIPIDNNLYEILKLYRERIKRNRDVLIICDGYEGDGKSTLMKGVCYVLSELLDREFTVENIFFNLKDMIEFATTTEKKIIMWDEAVLGGLRQQWQNKMQLKLIQLLNIARKKQHVFVFNIPRMKRLSEDLLDRAIGLLHVYSEDEIKVGTFAYYKKDSFINMYDKFKSSRKMLYRQYYDFIGRFPNYSDKYPVIDEIEYERKKDKAIMSLVEEEENKTAEKYKEEVKLLKMKIADLPIPQRKLAKMLGVSPNTINRWNAMKKENLIKIPVYAKIPPLPESE